MLHYLCRSSLFFLLIPLFTPPLTNPPILPILNPPLLRRNKRNRTDTLTQCAEWSQFAFQHCCCFFSKSDLANCLQLKMKEAMNIVRDRQEWRHRISTSSSPLGWRASKMDLPSNNRAIWNHSPPPRLWEALNRLAANAVKASPYLPDCS